MRRGLMALLLVALASCKDAGAPAAPRTVEEATKAFDEAVYQLSWAQNDLWALGGRDILVSVQLDSSLAPNYFRLPRRPK